MKRTNNRKGFTLAEVLIVVGILVVLMAVGFIALTSHARNMHQLEMDGQAKEIFVAAQNHLTMAESQGYMGISATSDTDVTTFGVTADAEKGIYYYVVGGKTGASPDTKGTALNQMLPFASVDESARTGGSYIIRYQKSPAVILDVFYVNTTGNYSLKDGFGSGDYATLMGTSPNYREDKSARKDFRKAIIGYYGGAAASDIIRSSVSLVAPTVEVINAEKLLVKVTNMNDAQSAEDAAADKRINLTLVITSVDGKAKKRIDLITNGDPDYAYTPTGGTSGRDFEITLDSVDSAASHFTKLAATGREFIPGEDLLIQAIVYNNNVATNIADSGMDRVNSLFESYDSKTGKVTVSNLRHLLNLDPVVSTDAASESLVSFSSIEQTSDMSWKDFKKNLNKLNHVDEDDVETTEVSIVTCRGTNPTANTFKPVKLTGTSGEGIITYDGKDHKISDIVVDTDAEYYAGLFSELNYVTVQNLELVDFNIKLSGSGAKAAGALAGTASNATITGVLVHNTQGAPNSLQIQSTGSAAGGLVGSLTGSSNIIEKCAAAVYVSATGDAGGLIGTASTTTVTDSYSGGHTKEGKYTDLPKSGISAVSVDDVRVNVISSSSNAGGLIGSAANSTIRYCYSTASAYGAVPSGLIGSAGSSTIEYCYASGKLFKADGTSVLPFVGAGYASDTFNGNYYLSNVSDLADDYTTLVGVEIGADEIEGVSSGNTSKTKFIVETKMEADVYDKTLLVDHAGRYVFPTIEQLHTLNGSTWTVTSAFINSFTQRHFGDFQVPGLSPLNYTFVNEHTLYSDVTLESDTQKVTVAVYGEHSTNARVFILDVIRNDSTKAIEKLCVSKEGTVANGAAGGSITWQNSADFTIGTKDDDDGKYYIPVKTTGDKTTFHLTLDDITDKDGHFTQLFNKGTALIPGENVTLIVGGGEGSWTELRDFKNKSSDAFNAMLSAKQKDEVTATNNPCAKTENSLFGTMTENKEITLADGTSVTCNAADIVYYRHLQNLDVTVSNASNLVTAAELKIANDKKDGVDQGYISWDNLTAEYSLVTTYNKTDYPTSGFVGLYNPNLTVFQGGNKTIKDLTITTADSDALGSDPGAGNAGFFRYVDSALTVEKLHLQDVTVTSTGGNAGAFAAEIASGKSLSLHTVLAEGSSSEITATGAAGGLVGLANGNTTVNNSAASMLVSTSGAAGGLIGQQAGGTADIKNSYVGGHTSGGKYSATDWNIVSASGAAGGLIGELSSGASAKITRTFNTASVRANSTSQAGGVVGLANGTFVADSGKILDLVYVIAPVSDVKTISGYTFVREEGEDDGYWAPVVSEENEGNAGSLIGSSAYEIDTTGSGFYFLPGIYTDPLPSDITLTDDEGNKTYKTNIKYIGDGTVTNVSLASYYMEEGGDNSLIGIKHETDLLEERTSAFDAAIKDRFEFPFAIWTTFSFEDSSPIRYFYGDWQPVLDENSKKLHVHFRAEIVKTDGTVVDPSAATVSELNARGMELAVQIPYRELEILLPYAASIDEFGFHISEWDLYYGDQTTGTLVNKTEGTLDAINASSSSMTLTASQFSNALQYGLESDNDPHITIVAKYSENTETTYKLQLWDWDKDAEPLGSAYKASGSYMVLKAKNADGSAMLLKTALEEKGLANQMPTLPGYRFRGWYTQQGGKGTPIYKTKYDSTKKTFVSEYAGSNTETVAGPVNLYAWYEPVPKQAIELDFYLKVGTTEPAQYGSYEFEFDAEKGFDANLPYPGENFKYVSQQKVAGTATITNDDTNSALHIVVAPSGVVLHSDPDKIQYNVTFEGSADLRGYVVLYELQHTKKDGDNYSYFLSTNSNASSSCVEQFSTNGEGTTKKDSRPKINTGDYSAPTEGFNFLESNTYDLTDTENPIPSDYSGKYKTSVVVGTGENQQSYTVQYVIILTYARETYELNFNSDGGTTYDPVRVEFDEPLYEKYLKNKTPVYGETADEAPYTFKWWSMPGQETNIASANPAERMPRQNLTVKAQKEGKPVAFKVAFWYENPDDDDYSFAGMKAYAANAASPAESGTSVKKAGDEISSSYFTTVNFDGKDNSIHGHFTYNSGKDETITLKGDGSSVLNVYFTRNKVTVTFTGRVKDQTNAETVSKDLKKKITEREDYVYKSGDHVYPVDLADNLPVIKTTYTYTPDNTTTSGTTYYGIVNGEYVELEYQENGKTYDWKPAYNYSFTTDRNTNTPYYGIKNQKYVNLTYAGSSYYYTVGDTDTDIGNGTTYYKEAEYLDFDDSYGIVDGKLVPLEFKFDWFNSGYYYDNGRYKYGDTRYVETNDPSNAFVFADGQMREVMKTDYWNADGVWYSSFKSGKSGNARYSGGPHFTRTGYTGAVIDPSPVIWQDVGLSADTIELNKTYYYQTDTPRDTINNCTYPVYAELAQLNAGSVHTSYTWTYVDAAGATKTYPTSNQRYILSGPGSNYTGTIYTRSDTGYIPVSNTANLNWENGEYFGVDTNGGHQRLTKTTVNGLIWYDEDGVAHVYTGTGNDFYRFRDKGNSGNVTMVWRGKWQARFSTYHFDWSMIDRYQWKNDDGITDTYLYGFVMDEYDNASYTDYGEACQGENGTREIRHYRQELDGTYKDEPAIAYSKDEDGVLSWTFTNKFNEFEVKTYDTPLVTSRYSNRRYTYTLGTSPTFSSSGGQHTTYHNDSHNDQPYNIGTPLYIYHERRSYNLTFISGTQTFGPYQVKFDRPFTENEVRSVVPAESSLNSLGEGYEFQGWCLAATMKAPTIYFGEGVPCEDNYITKNMPAGDLVIYAKWTLPDKTVTFTLGEGETMTAPQNDDGEWAFTVEHGTSIESYVSANNDWKLEYKPTTTNKDANGNEQVFDKWVYVKGNAEKEFFRSQSITTDLELKPKWKPKETTDMAQVTVYYVKKGTPADKLEDTDYILHEKKTYSRAIGDPIDETAPAIATWTPSGDSWVSRTAKKAEETVIFYYESTEWTYTVNYYVRLQSLNEDDQEDWVPGTYEQTPYTETEPIKTSDPDDPPTADDRFTLVTIESIPGYRLEEVEYPDGSETKTSKDAIIFLSKGENVVVNAYVVPDASTVFEQTVFSSQYAGTPQGLDSLVTPPEGIDLHYLYYQNGTLLKNSDNEPIQPENAGVYGVRAYATRTIGGKTYLIWQSEDVDGKPGIAFYITRRDVEITSPSVTNVFARTSENLNLFEVVDGVYKPKADSGLPNDAVLGGIARNQSTPSYTVPAGLNVTLSFAYSADSFRRTSSGSVDDYTPNVFSYRVTRGDESNFNFYLTFGKLYVWDKLSTYQAYLASLTPAQPETPADP